MQFRVQGVPLEWDKERLATFIAENVHVPPPEVRSICLEIHGLSKTATILSSELRQIRQTIRLDERKQSYLALDLQFGGITTLFQPVAENHKTDLIAISGLGGHAFGSFKERGGSHMWLRDSLPNDLGNNTRIMIYGYDSAVASSDSFQTLDDIALRFRHCLSRLTEYPDRPIVFVSHSLGGLVVKQMLAMLGQSKSPEDSILLRAVSGVVFFGVPHLGMDNSSLLAMSGGGPNRPLIEFLGTLNSQRLEKLQADFTAAADSIRIFVFFETKESPTAKQNERGEWKMDGPAVVLVNTASATRCLTPAHPTLMCPVNETHSNMVKFKFNDETYGIAITEIQTILDRPLRHMTEATLEKAMGETHNSLGGGDDFVGRKEKLQEIFNGFWAIPNSYAQAEKPWSSRHNHAELRGLAIHGAEGIGKTSLALKYAQEYLRRYDRFFFITASDAITFADGRKNIHAGADFAAWLQKIRGSWLLLIDNVVEETSAEAFELARNCAGTYQRGIGHVLFTTKLKAPAAKHLGLDNCFELDFLDRDEAKKMFLLITRSNSADWDPNTLSALPLFPIVIKAIADRARYSKWTSRDLHELLQEPNGVVDVLLTADEEQRGAGVDEEKASVRTMINHIKQCVPKSHLLVLAVLSYLHTDNLNLKLLQDCLKDISLQESHMNFPWLHWLWTWGSGTPTPTDQVQDTIALVEKRKQNLKEKFPDLNLVNLDPKGSVGRICGQLPFIHHSGLSLYIPEFLRNTICQGLADGGQTGQREIFTLSLILADEIMLRNRHSIHEDDKLANNFASLVSALNRHVKDGIFPEQPLDKWAHFVLTDINFEVADILDSRAWTKVAIRHYELALKHWPNTGLVAQDDYYDKLQNYGLALIDDRRFEDAEKQLRRTLEGLESLAGSQQPDAAPLSIWRVQHHILHLKSEQGMLSEPVEGFRKLLDDQKQLESQDFIELQLSYAEALENQGRYLKAKEALQFALRRLKIDINRTDASTDYDGAICKLVNDVALVIGNLGNYSAGDELLRKVGGGNRDLFRRSVTQNATIDGLIAALTSHEEEGRTGLRGDSEPLEQEYRLHVFYANLNLGLSLLEQERYPEATSHFAKVYEIRQESQAPFGIMTEADDMLLTEGIAWADLFNGHYNRAKSGFQTAHDSFAESEGKAWMPLPLLRAKEGLAMARCMQKEKGGTEQFKEVVSLAETVFGKEHPELFTTYQRYGMALKHQGNIQESVQWYYETLRLRKRILVEGHPLIEQAKKHYDMVVREAERLDGELSGSAK
ncbi:hypothetical protein GGR56DRAFT_612699 [Xylariaceae sp. FL0804]|nr:hypothetical protein GGR56DRAFT_612699 [Xylariaceae sp. FL0804]